jgi:uncharacterized protein YehS (DUF1456 family)
MINNDIYRRLRYLFGYQYDHVVALFASTGFEVNEAQYKGWAGTEEEDRFIRMTDRELAIFLNGIIIERRGAQGRTAAYSGRRNEQQYHFTKVKNRVQYAIRRYARDFRFGRS